MQLFTHFKRRIGLLFVGIFTYIHHIVTVTKTVSMCAEMVYEVVVSHYTLQIILLIYCFNNLVFLGVCKEGHSQVPGNKAL